MFDCILLMAGLGERTKLNYNKVNYLLNGKRLYEYSLDLFKSMKEINKIILVVNEKEYQEFKELEKDNIKVVLGGKRRQDSVYNGLLCAECDICLIHDAARPNIKANEVLEVYENTKKYQAAVLGRKTKYALKEVCDGFVSKTLNRDMIYEMQTPQGVMRDLMLKGLEKLKDVNVFDDIEVLEKVYGIKAKLVLGSEDNIKLTTESDLDYFKYMFEVKK